MIVMGWEDTPLNDCDELKEKGLYGCDEWNEKGIYDCAGI